jgi:N-acetylglucosamine kinase-like BadF-type ATPase
MGSPSPVVVGVDAGGTCTRVLVADLAGRPLGRGHGPGANPLAHGLTAARAALRGALAEALGEVDPQAVESVVIGLAGDRLAGESDASAALAGVLGELGLTGRHRVVGDALVSYAAATPEPDGALLISGTGAVAVRVLGRAIADTAGGHGWLLGDEGSGFWLGREAVRTAVDALRGRAAAPRLAELVVAEVLGPVDPGIPGRMLAEQLLTAVYAAPPLRLAALARCVSEADRAGDPGAAGILDRAAGHLAALLAQVRPENPEAPVVLAGSCLAPDVLGRRTVRLITARGPARVLRAADGAAGAAWLAAVPLLDGEQLARLHEVLTVEPR